MSMPSALVFKEICMLMLFDSVFFFSFLFVFKNMGTKGTTHKGKRFLAQVKGCLLCRREVC